MKKKIRIMIVDFLYSLIYEQLQIIIIQDVIILLYLNELLNFNSFNFIIILNVHLHYYQIVYDFNEF